MKLRSAFVFAGLSSVIVSGGMGLGLAACSSSAAPAAPAAAGNGRTGKVNVALSSVGPDGATYSLEDGYLEIDNASGFLESTGFTGAATQSFNLPTGPYSILLDRYGNEADAGNEWTLTRTLNGVSTPVVAFLTDSLPIKLDVVQDETVVSAFHFTVPTVGDLTFSTGTLTTTIQVDGGSAPAGHADAVGIVPFTSVTTGTNTAVNALFASWDSPSTSVNAHIALTSPFAASVDSACASGTVQLSATAVNSGTSDTSVAALFTEMNGAEATICLDDNLNGNDGAVWIYLFKFGQPTTSAFIGALGTNASGADMQVYFQLTPTAPLYTGSVAELSALGQPVSMPIGYVQGYVLPGDGSQLSLYGSGSATTTMTLQITP